MLKIIGYKCIIWNVSYTYKLKKKMCIKRALYMLIKKKQYAHTIHRWTHKYYFYKILSSYNFKVIIMHQNNGLFDCFFLFIVSSLYFFSFLFVRNGLFLTPLNPHFWSPKPPENTQMMQRWCSKLRLMAALHSVPKQLHHHHHPLVSSRLLHTSSNLLHRPSFTHSVVSPNLTPFLDAPLFPLFSYSPLSVSSNFTRPCLLVSNYIYVALSNLFDCVAGGKIEYFCSFSFMKLFVGFDGIFVLIKYFGMLIVLGWRL